MSLTIMKKGNSLQLLNGYLPEGTPVKVFTEAEMLQFEGWKQWMALTEEQREDMMLQTQSASYKEWMEEENWPECQVNEDSGQPRLGQFEA